LTPARDLLDLRLAQRSGLMVCDYLEWGDKREPREPSSTAGLGKWSGWGRGFQTHARRRRLILTALLGSQVGQGS
jgi:hypothetical protein